MSEPRRTASPARPVLRLGTLAAACLVPGAHGTILASTSRAIYLMGRRREILWIANGPIALHRRCIDAAGPLPQVTPRASWTVIGQQLKLDARTAFDLVGAKPWHPPTSDPIVAVPSACMLSALVDVASWMMRVQAPSGLGVLIPDLIGLFGHSFLPEVTTALTPVASRARRVMGTVLDRCLAHEPRSALVCAQQLVGLGEGLTPSGDDVLGGFLYVHSRLALKPSGSIVFGSRDVDAFLHAARSRTNPLSYCLLADLAHGHASEVATQFVDHLFAGRDPERLRHQATVLVRMGHSTGWDLLTGVTLGVLVMAGATEPGQHPVTLDACLLQA